MESNFDHAIPFITFSEKIGFSLSKEAEEFLLKMENQKLGIISIVGKYRTGKSFFVNRVLLQKSGNGFSVGPTINPCTKGLWLWPGVLPSDSENDDTKVLLVDTEGFGGMDENVNHDSRIFLFSLLLSSFFIYNSVGNIDEQALNSLSLIINLAKEIQLKSQGGSDLEKDDLSGFFPNFLWVVRDFALRMVDPNGQPITPKDYLEKALELQKGVSDSIESKNRIRRLFKHFFKERDCATLVRPIENEKDLQSLNSMDDSLLRNEFIEQSKSIRRKIMKKIKPKTFFGKAMDGPMLIQLCKTYIDTLNKGSMPNIENAWNYLCKFEANKAIQEGHDEIERILFESSQGKPLNEKELKEKKKELRQNLEKIFNKRSIGDSEDVQDFKAQLFLKFKERFSEFIQTNAENWSRHYESLFSPSLEDFLSELKMGTINNLASFQTALNALINSFMVSAPASKMLNIFVEKMKSEIFLKGMEYIIRSNSEVFDREKRVLEMKLSLIEQEFNAKKKEFEEERYLLIEKLREKDREVAELKASERAEREKNAVLKADMEKMEEKNEKIEKGYREREERVEREAMERIRSTEERISENRNKFISQFNESEKNYALSAQELGFAKKEISILSGKNDSLENEVKKLRIEVVNTNNNCDRIKQRLNETENQKNQELGSLKSENEKKLKDLLAEIEKSKEVSKKYNEISVEKTYLENQISFLKNQLDENKRLHDALLMALQQGINNNENESTNELVETNRYLSAAMEKMEIRCKILEEKCDKLKNFKKMIKNSCSLQCLHCSKHITPAIFLQHIATCLTELQNATNNNSQQQSSFLQISINQTMVKESADNKPYTEYSIQMTTGEGANMKKWTICRRYKNFCELYYNLINQFPSLELPPQILSVLSASTDINNIFNSKRPTVIEERRKALQMFLRELAKIDVIRNSRIFKNFIELDDEGGPMNNNPYSNRDLNQNLKNHSIVSVNMNKDLVPREVNNILSKENYENKRSSFGGSIFLPEEITLPKDLNLKIDKKMLPQSPSSFLNNWNNERIERMNLGLNKENKNPRSKSVSDNKLLNFKGSSQLEHANIAAPLNNDIENDNDKIDVSNISSSVQGDIPSLQETSQEKSLLSLLKGENNGKKKSIYNIDNKTGLLPTKPNIVATNQIDLYAPKNIYSNSNSYSSNYEKKKIEKVLGMNEKIQPLPLGTKNTVPKSLNSPTMKNKYSSKQNEKTFGITGGVMTVKNENISGRIAENLSLKFTKK